MDKVVVTIAFLSIAFFMQYAFQWYTAHYTPEAIIDDVDIPENLEKHTEEFGERTIIRVTKGIHVAVGYALANSILLEAPDGNIIVDTTEAMSSARAIRQAFRNVSDRPIRAIIYTHYHPDHVFGAEAFIDDPAHPPDVWAHHSLPERLHRFVFTGPILYRRSVKQFGRFIPNLVNAGIGPRLMYDKDAQNGLVFPNRFLQQDSMQVEIAGLHLQLVHIPGETSDQIGVWLPDAQAFLCADDLYKAFPNLYAIRGTPPRDVRHWVESLDKILRFRPRYLVPSHTRPLEGREHIAQVITIYHDAIQFVHDQTLRYMNQGLHPSDIVRRVQLPEKLQNHPYLQQFYGTVEWSVRGVFDSYMGWFSGDATELSPLAPDDRAHKLVQLAGGISALLEQAQVALDTGETQWALELSTAALTVKPGHSTAQSVRLGALRTLAAQQSSANGRNYYLSCALDDHGLINNVANIHRMLTIIPMQYIFDAMSTRMMAEKCSDYNMLIVFNFTDTAELFTGHMRHGIFDVHEGSSDREVALRVTTTSEIWRQILAKQRNAMLAYWNSKIIVHGGVLNFVKFFLCFDRT